MGSSIKVGDVVMVTRPVSTNSHPLTGLVGSVKHIKEGDDSIGVEFNVAVGGHDLDGHGKAPFGWWVRSGYLQRMEPIATAFQNQWKKEWMPRLKKEKKTFDQVIIVEE